MLRKVILSALFIIYAFVSKAQELNCVIQVNTTQIQSSDKKIYETLQKELFEFMNNRRWTSDQFLNQERIECTFLINISDRPSNDEFKATIQVQSRRPVYKSSYNSSVFVFNDADFSFKYVEYQPLEYSDNTFTNSLTQVMAFYAYIIIGLDYDTFAPEGGAPYYQKAQTVVNNAQNSPDKGWRAFEGIRNRYWIAENLNHEQFKPYRQALYKYHRNGLDEMTNNKDNARVAIMESLDLLKKVNVDRPASLLEQIFFTAKSDELVNIFGQALPDEKVKAINILNEVDPTNTSKYQAISRGE